MNATEPAEPRELPPSSRVILAAGGMLWQTDARERLCLVHRPRYDDWSLPKGKWDAGETLEACARREIEEETNCRAALGPFADVVRYTVKGAAKFVFFWHMRVMESRPHAPNEEVDELAWLRVDEALTRLTHDDERRLLARCR